MTNSSRNYQNGSILERNIRKSQEIFFLNFNYYFKKYFFKNNFKSVLVRLIILSNISSEIIRNRIIVQVYFSKSNIPLNKKKTEIFFSILLFSFINFLKFRFLCLNKEQKITFNKKFHIPVYVNSLISFFFFSIFCTLDARVI